MKYKNTAPWDMPEQKEYDKELIEEFQCLWHDLPNRKPFSTWDGVYWRGVKVVKSPNDMLLYAMKIHELKPTLIVETGTAFGGSALFFAEMGRCPVISIDNVPYRPEWPQHRDIHYMHSRNSTDPEVLEHVAKIAAQIGRGPILVSLDSDHNAPHVFEELQTLGRIARYIVVEDTCLGHPIPRVNYVDGGPWEAVDTFLNWADGEFFDQWEEEKLDTFLFSSNRWLKRRAS
jgi:cephalosporin hydroxylase